MNTVLPGVYLEMLRLFTASNLYSIVFQCQVVYCDHASVQYFFFRGFRCLEKRKSVVPLISS